MTTKNAAGTTTGTWSFSYDQAGNMTGRTLAGQSAQTLAWDAEGELTSLAQDGNGDGDTADANEADEADEYLYSADGERLVRTQDGASTLYLPGGMELTAYADGRASTANRYYSFNGKTITTRAAVGATGQTTIIPDHHGTPMLQVDQSTNRVTRQYTDPFGATRGCVVGDFDSGGRLDGTNPAWVGDHGYLDKPEDSTGLTAVGARMYDPVLGRFISADPVMDLTDPQQWNAYAYSNGNPVTWADPSGLLVSIGLLLDGAYTPPTRGKPGSGGRQVAGNNTGYTGHWNHGGAAAGISAPYWAPPSRGSFGSQTQFAPKPEPFIIKALDLTAPKSTVSPLGPPVPPPTPVCNFGAQEQFYNNMQYIKSPEGVEAVTGKWADLMGYGSALGWGVGLFAPPVAAIGAGLGYMSASIYLVNGVQNMALGNGEEALQSFGNAGIGAATGGIGYGLKAAGSAAAANSMVSPATRTSGLGSDIVLNVGGIVVGKSWDTQSGGGD